jgi:hypothetical protein
MESFKWLAIKFNETESMNDKTVFTFSDVWWVVALLILLAFSLFELVKDTGDG